MNDDWLQIRSPLKPCPFCGSEAKLRLASEWGGVCYRVECKDCFARTYSEHTEKEAVEAWNRRAGESNV